MALTSRQVAPQSRVGQRFGRLVVLEILERVGTTYRVRCRCDCGGARLTRLNTLVTGASTQCAECKQARARALRLTHGKSGSAEFSSWASMIGRCTNPNNQDWERYGGRGIAVCRRWLDSFEAFLEDMGPRPPGTTIERKENDGAYEPGNCVWATRKAQAVNRAVVRWVIVDGSAHTLTDAAKLLGVTRTTVRKRISRGLLQEVAAP